MCIYLFYYKVLKLYTKRKGRFERWREKDVRFSERRGTGSKKWVRVNSPSHHPKTLKVFSALQHPHMPISLSLYSLAFLNLLTFTVRHPLSRNFTIILITITLDESLHKKNSSIWSVFGVFRLNMQGIRWKLYSSLYIFLGVNLYTLYIGPDHYFVSC